MDQVLKAYKYISDAKVDVLYAQIPRGLLDGIAVDLNIDLKLAVVEASAAVKRRDQPKLVYWGGSTEHTILGLGGSPRHMIGQVGDATMGQPSSALPYLVAFLAEHLQVASPPVDADPVDPLDCFDAVEVTNRHLKGGMPRFEFLAEFLLDDSDHKRIRPHRRIMIGSPIYVALAG